jgi:hypothetical protein
MTLITVTPGPTIRVYRDGALVAEVPLTIHAAGRLIAELAKETWRAN